MKLASRWWPDTATYARSFCATWARLVAPAVRKDLGKNAVYATDELNGPNYDRSTWWLSARTFDVNRGWNLLPRRLSDALFPSLSSHIELRSHFYHYVQLC